MNSVCGGLRNAVDPDVRLQEVQRLLLASRERFSRGSFAHILFLREQGGCSLAVRKARDRTGIPLRRPPTWRELLRIEQDNLSGNGRIGNDPDVMRSRRDPASVRLRIGSLLVAGFGRSARTTVHLDALRNEQRPFNLVHTVCSQLAASATTGSELMERHLAAVRAKRAGHSYRSLADRWVVGQYRAMGYGICGNPRIKGNVVSVTCRRC